jgi:lipid-A-disaccharide synthase
MMTDPQASTGCSKRIFISTGEVSGDLQGSFLVQALHRQAIARGMTLDIVALGGQRMRQAGAQAIDDTTAIGSMGLIESIPFIFPTLAVQRRAKRYLKANPPDATVLIDYMTPNMVIGRYLRETYPGRPVVYYIAPQAWVWQENESVTRRILACCDRIIAVFAAEAHYYSHAGAQTDWFGHPLIDTYPQRLDRAGARRRLGVPDDRTIVALLPASRRQELKYIMQPMFAAAQQLQERAQRDGQPEIEFWIPLSQPQFRPQITQAIRQYRLNATFIPNDDLTRLAACDLALTKSGTVNLELALMGVPQVVVYALHPFTSWVLRTLLKFEIPFASPVNLVLMREVVPELLQEKATPDRIFRSALELLYDREREARMQLEYAAMRTAMGEAGVCDRVADSILDSITDSGS